MKIVLSPAKALQTDNIPNVDSSCELLFPKEAERLASKLGKMSAKKISKLMNLSPALGELNFDRYQEWAYPFIEEKVYPAVMMFNGEAYRGLDAQSLDINGLDYLQNNLRILSGLYGLIKPLDSIAPYRLEMGTKFQVTPKIKNLYQYWGTKLSDHINQELKEDDGVLVNLASSEYFKALNPKAIKGRVITCSFKENKGGDYKMIMVFAKNARGAMTRFMAENKIADPDHLKAFDKDGYVFNPSLSTENDLVFTRG